MLTEASRGGHLSVANLLLRQPRLQQSSHHSSTRASKDYHHYERIKLAPGRKSHGRNPHHHYTTQGGSGAGKSQKPAAASSNESGPANHQNHGQVCRSVQIVFKATLQCVLYVMCTITYTVCYNCTDEACFFRTVIHTVCVVD